MTKNTLTELVYAVDTNLRKQQKADKITSSVFPHRLLLFFFFIGMATVHGKDVSNARPTLPNPIEFRHLLAISSCRAPMSPIIFLLLLDPYPTKQLRGAIHSLF